MLTGVGETCWMVPRIPLSPTAGTATITSWPAWTCWIPLSGTSKVTCQLLEVRSASIGSADCVELLLTLAAGPSGSSENGGDCEPDDCDCEE